MFFFALVGQIEIHKVILLLTQRYWKINSDRPIPQQNASLSVQIIQFKNLYKE